MTVTVMQAAKRLCQRSGWTLSNLQLQKILYIAHMMYLGKTGQPLVNGHFEAWDYGPVEPELYHYAKTFGASPIKGVFRLVPDLEDDQPEAQELDKAVQALSNVQPGQLVAMTHWDGGAWAKHYLSGRCNSIIRNQDIIEEYRARAKQINSN